MDEIVEDLLELTGMYAPSGHEEEMAEYLFNRFEPLLDDVYIDENDNVVGVKYGTGPTVIVDAHIDEISRRKQEYREFEPQLDGTTIRAKGLDDRTGVAVLLDVARYLNELDSDGPTVYLVGATKEEIGQIGAGEVAADVLADYAISVDVTYMHGVRRGDGPVITKAPDTVPHKATDALFTAGKEHSIPVQVSPYDYDFDVETTDALPYRELGMDTAVVCIPIANMHRVPEVGDVRDVRATAEVVKGALEQFDRHPPTTWPEMLPPQPADQVTQDLIELTSIYAPSRRERPVAEYLVDNLSSYLDECYIDEHNNFVGVKHGTGPSVLVDAHIDEVPHWDHDYEPQLDGTRITTKALDDRAGVAVLMDVARNLGERGSDGPTVYIVGASMEEIGQVGAGHIAEKIHPDYAIAVDVTYLDRVEMGGGPVITKAPKSVAHEATDALFAAGEELGMTTQVSPYSYRFDIRTTDGLPYFEADVDTAVLSIPIDNMHSIPETGDVRDVRDSAALVTAAIERLGREE